MTTTIPPQPSTHGFKNIINRVSTIRDSYPNSISIYRDLNTAYQSCYEIAVNVSEQYTSYRRAGQRISGIRTLLTDCDAILKKVHGFLQRYASLRSQRPTSKERFAFVSEDIGFQRRRLGVCREKLVSVQKMLHGYVYKGGRWSISVLTCDSADYSSQHSDVADEAGAEIPVENADSVPPVEGMFHAYFPDLDSFLQKRRY